MRVMMQGFYWNCMRQTDKSWYQIIKEQVPALKESGIDIIWLPPPARGMNSQGMGYDIKEHYNLDSAFGSRQELTNLIDKMKSYNLVPTADTVMAHMIGGNRQYNPYYEQIKNKHAYSYTDFPEPEFPKNYQHFCRKCGDCEKMESDFGEKICHYADGGYMKDGLIAWGQWLKEEIGFSGFRLDYVKDMKQQFVKEWAAAVDPKFIVGEYWSGDQKVVSEWIDYTGVKAFDFPLFYDLQKMCNQPDSFNMQTLPQKQVDKSVSFVSNHDVSRKEPIVKGKELAYAYILLFTQLPCIFWKDYYNHQLKPEIDNLLAIRQKMDKPFTVEYTDYDLLVGEQDGYRIYINKSKQKKIYQGLKIPPRDYIWQTEGRERIDLGARQQVK